MLSGCGLLESEGGSDGGGEQSVVSAEAETARGYLESIFSTLSSTTLFTDGTVALDPDQLPQADIEQLESELTGAEQSLQEISQAEQTPSAERATVEGGVLLADARVTIYRRARNIRVRESQYAESFDAGEYDAALEYLNPVQSRMQVIDGAARQTAEIVRRFRNEGVSSPDFYQLDEAQSEAEQFISASEDTQRVVAGIRMVTDALGNAIDGQRQLTAEAYDSAEGLFLNAVDSVVSARDEFAAVSGQPTVFASQFEARRCDLDTLETALVAAREGAAAAADGDDETASERLNAYESEFESYRQNCL